MAQRLISSICFKPRRLTSRCFSSTASGHLHPSSILAQAIKPSKGKLPTTESIKASKTLNNTHPSQREIPSLTHPPTIPVLPSSSPSTKSTAAPSPSQCGPSTSPEHDASASHLSSSFDDPLISLSSSPGQPSSSRSRLKPLAFLTVNIGPLLFYRNSS